MIVRLATLALLFAFAASSTRADVVERVVATVNNDAIFLSDLRARAVPFLPQVAEARTETERMARLKELYEELLTYLIDEKLIRQIAALSGIRVTEADVDVAIENVGGDLFSACLGALCKDGRLVFCGGHGGAVVPLLGGHGGARLRHPSPIAIIQM